MATPRIDDRNWSALSTGQRIHQLEVEGYLVLPDLLDADHIARLKAITATFETTAVDYSERQRGRNNIQSNAADRRTHASLLGASHSNIIRIVVRKATLSGCFSGKGFLTRPRFRNV